MGPTGKIRGMVHGQWGPSGSGGGASLANSVIGVELIKDGSERLIRNWKATWSAASPTEWKVSPYRLQNGPSESMILPSISKIVQSVFNLSHHQYIAKPVL